MFSSNSIGPSPEGTDPPPRSGQSVGRAASRQSHEPPAWSKCRGCQNGRIAILVANGIGFSHPCCYTSRVSLFCEQDVPLGQQQPRRREAKGAHSRKTLAISGKFDLISIDTPFVAQTIHPKPIMSKIVKQVQLSGILDSTKASQFRTDINNIVKAGTDYVLIDLKEVTFVDSSGLGALVSALKTVRSASGKLCICSINEQVRMLFELTSMDRVFRVFKNQEEFEEALQKGQV